MFAGGAFPPTELAPIEVAAQPELPVPIRRPSSDSANAGLVGIFMRA